MRIINFFLISFFFFGTSLGATTPGENQSSDGGFVFFSRPDPIGTPTLVKAGMVFLDVKKIDDVEQNFDADIFMTVGWFDPRLADKTASGVRFFRMNDIWQPHVTIYNPRKLDKQMDDVFIVDPQGNVQYQQRFIGKLSSPLNLKDFPFDRQTLPVTLLSIRYGPEEIDLQVDEKRFTMQKGTSVVGWSVKLDKPRVGSEYFDVQDRYLSRIDFNLAAQRHTRHYLLKIIFPMLLIIFMAWAVFWIDPSMIGTQIGVATASVFSLILFHFRVGQLLPKVSYLTRLDKAVLGATLVVFFALAITIITSRLAKSGKEELGRKFDRWSRWIYLGLVVFLALYSFVF